MTETGPDTSDGGYLTDASAGQHPRILIPGSGVTIDRQDDRLTLAAGGGPSLQTGAMVHLDQLVTDYDYNNVPFDTVDYDSDGFWDVDNNQMLVPAGKGGLYLVQASVWISASDVIDGASFEVTLGSTHWNYDPLPFDLTKVVAAGANDWRGSYAMAVHMGDTCISRVDGFAVPYRPTRTINILGHQAYFAIWRLGDLGYDG